MFSTRNTKPLGGSEPMRRVHFIRTRVNFYRAMFQIAKNDEDICSRYFQGRHLYSPSGSYQLQYPGIT